jgi:formylglycine-generating enzyme required for sulfatase activity
MGSPEQERHLADWGLPQHRVRITRPFYIGTTEVTRGQFRQFVEAADYRTEAERNGSNGTWRNPGFEQTDEHPAVHVSWNDAVAFCRWLSHKEGETYRLPTEAEWEYACRAGTTTRYSSGEALDGLAAVGNIADETFRRGQRSSGQGAITASDGFVHTAPVGRYSPNAWGLFDMHGNVCEWCSDKFEKDYYHRSPVDDPPGPAGAEHRVIRGGSFLDHPDKVRSAYRIGSHPEDGARFMGFRPVRVPSDC